MTASKNQSTALVTGPSSGIGALYADRLARRGYDPILVTRHRERLEALAQRLTRETGRTVDLVVADLADRQDVGRVEAVLRSDARITLLVNNAGVGSTAPLLNADVDTMADMIAVTLDTVPYTTTAHPMRGRDGASPRGDGRLDVQGSSPGAPGSGTTPEMHHSLTAKLVFFPRRSMLMSAVSSSPTWRTCLATVAATGAFGLVLLAAPGDAQTATTKETTMAQRETTTAAIRPFHVHVPDEALVDLRRRINATKWPERETVTDASQGVQLATIQALARYWATEYDWRKIEAKMNALPQFITEIDGLDIHFLHVRSKHENALPLIVTHGWPGSIIEQMKIIDPLTNPTAHGGNASDAFHLVIPSMPGYGYSGKPTTTGWDVPHIARAWVVLMKRLGYTRYVAQGGDWGALVVDQMGLQAPPELLGIHTNMPGIFPADIDGAAFSGAPAPSGLSADEKLAYERLQFVYQKGIAYGFQMGLRPQTLYGIVDSPVGLAAYFLDHDARSYELISRVFQGQAEGLTRDDILDNITITWLTNTALSGARLYWENWGKLGYFNAKGVSIPVAVSVFPDELYPAPRSWAERAYPKLIHYNKLDKGGHFAAWEQPELFAAEIRAAFKSLR